MKNFLIGLIALMAVSASAQIQTRVWGNTMATNCLVACTKPTVLYAVTGYSSATQYIMVFQTNNVPVAGATERFAVPVNAGQYY